MSSRCERCTLFTTRLLTRTQGFLRRVHRYPVYIPPNQPFSYDPAYNGPLSAHELNSTSSLARKRARSFNNPAALRFPAFTSPLSPPPISTAPNLSRQLSHPSSLAYGGSSSGGGILSPVEALSNGSSDPSAGTGTGTNTHRARRVSAAEKVLEQLRNRDVQKSAGGTMHSPLSSWSFPTKEESPTSTTQSATSQTPTSVANSYSTTFGSATTATGASVATLRAAPIYSAGSPIKQGGQGGGVGGRDSRRTSLLTGMPPSGPPPSPVMPKLTMTAPSRRGTRSPSTPLNHQAGGQSAVGYPAELIPLLDGDHHTDEIGVRLNVGWPQLEQWLVALGGGQGNGDFGEAVVITYR